MDAPPPPPTFKRSWFRFPAPGKQLALFLPTAALLAVLFLIGFFSAQRMRSQALEVLASQGVSSEASHEFLKKTRGFNVLITAVSVAVGVAAVGWVWWLSVWIFGPYRRLERDLNEVLYGRMDPDKIRVRKGDALYSLVERMRQVMTKRTPPPAA